MSAELTKPAPLSRIRPTPFSVGETVYAINGSHGKITAIGEWRIKGELLAVVYRLGRNQYWSDWQLRRKPWR